MNLLDIQDALIEIWRWSESGDTGKETALETNMSNFQSNLAFENRWLGNEAASKFVGPPEEDVYTDWNPFSMEELDAIRHYYGQKMALETTNPITAIGAPLAHEALDTYGLNSEWMAESLYDLSVNAIAVKDHYMNEGYSGKEFSDKLLIPAGDQGGTWEEEFMKYGIDALNRVPVQESWKLRRDDEKY